MSQDDRTICRFLKLLPFRGTEKLQVLASKISDKNTEIVPAVVMSVYRGSVCRKGKSAGRVKISKLMPTELPSALAAKVHVVALKCVEGLAYEASPLSTVHMLDPVVAVLGELDCVSFRTGSVSLRVTLSDGSQKALKSLTASKKRMDVVAKPPVEETKVPKEFLSACDLSRPNAAPLILKFMQSLPGRYAACKQRLVDSNGMVKVGGPRWGGVVEFDGV